MKKLLALILALTLCLSAIPLAVTAFAADTEYEYFYLGSYPQSKVENDTITAELDKLLPDWKDWTSYKYYSGDGNYGSMVEGDWMRYFDVTYGGEKYRAVKFTGYRPYYVTNDLTSSNLQYKNGYYLNTVYWFKFETLKWRILDKNTGLVMCETVIDSQPFTKSVYRISDSYYNDSQGENYANDYESSSIKEWLNNDFYNTAFSDDEKTAISKTTLNNDSFYTLTGDTGYEKYDGNETEDNVFLLSFDVLSDEKYGFTDNASRKAYCSEYAKSQGIQSSSVNSSLWWLRTPANAGNNNCVVSSSGEITVGANRTISKTSSATWVGIRPAMTVDLSYYDKPTEVPQPTEPAEPTENNTLANYILNVVYEFIMAIVAIIRSYI